MHLRGDAFNVLDVQRGKHINFRVEDFLHVLVAFAMAAAGDVGVRQLVHQCHLGPPGQDGIHIHFLENGAAVFDFLPWDDFQLPGQVFNPLAAVRLHHSDHHVFATAAAANRFAEHAEGFSHTRGVTQKELQRTLGFLRRGGDCQPFFRLFRQWRKLLGWCRGLAAPAGQVFPRLG